MRGQGELKCRRHFFMSKERQSFADEVFHARREAVICRQSFFHSRREVPAADEEVYGSKSSAFDRKAILTNLHFYI